MDTLIYGDELKTILLRMKWQFQNYISFLENIKDITTKSCQKVAYNASINVTVSAKTVLNGTCIITRKTDLKYSRCCGSVVLDFSHARFTV